MKKKIFTITVSGLMLTCIFIYWNFRYVQFYKINFDNQDYVVSKEKLSPEFYNNLKTVLNCYNEDFKEQNEVIYIRYSLYSNEDLIYNYTKKANDPAWLSIRKSVK